MLDEIGIKKGLQNLPNGIIRGYVDIGDNAASSNDKIAKDALVLMVVSLTSNWKLPIGYFLINGLDSSTHAGIINDALSRLHDVGVKVVSLTLDGPSQHFSTMRLLGASFNMTNTKPFFPHPISFEKIYIIFDACHMLKLMRNCLAEYQVLKNNDGQEIKWDYIVHLAEIQKTELIRAGNKLKQAHIEYKKMKMKVFLAAQTLSSSVADSITFCNDSLKLPQFEGSEETVKFIKCIDRLFDFMNSRNPLAKNFKAPLRVSNENVWCNQILSELEYLKSLTNIDNIPMWKTKRYVPFVGFITAVEAVIDIFDSYVKPPNSPIKYLLTYKLSQDHLELFFSAIRNCGGWCPNPTCAQFISAYKRLLMRHEVKVLTGNAALLQNIQILHVSSTKSAMNKFDVYDSSAFENIVNARVAKKYNLDNEISIDYVTNDLDFFEFQNEISNNLSQFTESCVGYICGWIVKKLIDEKKCIIKCETCRIALIDISDEDVSSDIMRLIRVKTRGGLLYPSHSVYKICSYAEILIRQILYNNNKMVPPERNFLAVLCSKILHELIQPPCDLFPSLNDHLFDDAADDLNHIYLLTKQICKMYIRLRLFAATKICNDTIVGEKIRHNLTRQIIWQHQ